MKGTNPARPQETGDGLSLWVQDVFYTLQGEGPFVGQPAVFVRLSGCNLKCFWCDTDFESSTWIPSLDELLAHIRKKRPASCDLVVVTGGEPFRQNIRPLIERLLADGLRVQIETNGTLWVDLPESDRLFIVCSPKTHSLSEPLEARVSAYKYVITAGKTSEVDGLPVASTQNEGRQTRIARPASKAPVYVMPLDSGNADANRLNTGACLKVALEHGYNVTLQTHKILQID